MTSRPTTAPHAQKAKERKAFEAFLRAYPGLAARICSWDVQEDEGAFPDVLVQLHGGQALGFELGEWVHEEQIKQGKKTDQFISAILSALGRPQPENKTQHIHCVLLTAKNDRIRFDERDCEQFRKELFDLTQRRTSNGPMNAIGSLPKGITAEHSTASLP